MRLLPRLLPLSLAPLGLLVLLGCAPEAEQEAPTDAQVTDPAPPPASDPSREDGSEPAGTGSGEPAAEDGARPALSDVGLTLTPVAQASEPTDATRGPDGTLLVAERAGVVRPLTGEGLAEPVLDLSERTSVDSERGLLGIAADEAALYVSFTDLEGASIVERYPWRGGRPEADRATALLEVPQPFANHNGGAIEVGPDGALWVALGDGGGAGDPIGAGQDRATPLGALLRLDPETGDAAADNPFVGESGVDARIWGYGLRNPWRFSFDAQRGDLWIADVGQADREEINLVPAGGDGRSWPGAGANFGWNLMEGTEPFAGAPPPGHWEPVHEYVTGVDGCAVTGGVVYRGQALPDLAGAYLYSDFCAGGVRAIRVEDGAVTDAHTFPTDGAGSVVAFAEDADGEVLLLTFSDGIVGLEPAAP